MFAFRIIGQTFGLFFLLQNAVGDMNDMMRNQVLDIGNNKVYLEGNKEEYKFLTTKGGLFSKTLDFKQNGKYVGGWRDKAPINLALCERSDKGNGVDYLYYLAKVDSNNMPEECFQVTASFDEATSIGTLQRTNSDGKVQKYKNFDKGDGTKKLIFKKQPEEKSEPADGETDDKPEDVPSYKVVPKDHNRNFKVNFLKMGSGGENHDCFVERQEARYVDDNPIPNIYFGIKCENKESTKKTYFHADHSYNDRVYADIANGPALAVVLCPENSRYVLRESNGNSNLKDCFDVTFDENEDVLTRVWDSSKKFIYDKVDANDKNKLVFKVKTEDTATRRLGTMNNRGMRGKRVKRVKTVYV